MAATLPVITERLAGLGWEDLLMSVLLGSASLFWASQVHQNSKKPPKILYWVPQADSKNGRSGSDGGSGSSSSPTSRNICDSLTSAEPSIVVFWGSQGGTAETFASRFASDIISRFSIFSMTADLSDYDHEHLGHIPEHAIIVFMLATFGEGDPTDNAVALMDHLLLRKAENLRLDKLRFAIFGLGDSNYLYFNNVAKKVNQLMTDLGAQRIGPLGLGDDCKGATEEDFIAWKACVFDDFTSTLGLKEAASTYKPRVHVESMHGLTSLDHVYMGEPHMSYLPGHLSKQRSPSYDPTAPLILPVTEARELCQKENRNILHMEFSLDDSTSAKYESGDYLEIWPMNPEDEVVSLMKILGLWEQRSNVISITPPKGSHPSQQSRNIFPTTPTTIESLFRYYLDVCGPVSREFLLGILQFVPDNDDGLASKGSFNTLCSDINRFQNEVTSQHLSLAEVLQKLLPKGGSLSIPLTYVVEHLKRMKPRLYSIASSSVVNPRRIAVSALVLNQQIPNRVTADAVTAASSSPRKFNGITTNYLLQLQQNWSCVSPSTAATTTTTTTKTTPCSKTYSSTGPRNLLKNTKIFAQIRQSKFKPPQNPETPIIMISTGTGVAPFRAFVQERAALKQHHGARVGKTMLFVGHRNPEEDFLYCSEWEEARRVLGKDCFVVFSAFSRWDGTSTAASTIGVSRKKCYVQDILKENIDTVLDILADNDGDGGNETGNGRGAVYICGSSAMATSVKTCIKEGRTSSSGGSNNKNTESGSEGVVDADTWLRGLKQSSRLFEDTWG